MMRHLRSEVKVADASSTEEYAFCTSRHARDVSSYHWVLKYSWNLTDPVVLIAKKYHLAGHITSMPIWSFQSVFERGVI